MVASAIDDDQERFEATILDLTYRLCSQYQETQLQGTIGPHILISAGESGYPRCCRVPYPDIRFLRHLPSQKSSTIISLYALVRGYLSALFHWFVSQ